jgi:biotin operon repressor
MSKKININHALKKVLQNNSDNYFTLSNLAYKLGTSRYRIEKCLFENIDNWDIEISTKRPLKFKWKN